MRCQRRCRRRLCEDLRRRVLARRNPFVGIDHAGGRPSAAPRHNASRRSRATGRPVRCAAVSPVPCARHQRLSLGAIAGTARQAIERRRLQDVDQCALPRCSTPLRSHKGAPPRDGIESADRLVARNRTVPREAPDWLPLPPKGQAQALPSAPHSAALASIQFFTFGNSLNVQLLPATTLQSRLGSKLPFNNVVNAISLYKGLCVIGIPTPKASRRQGPRQARRGPLGWLRADVDRRSDVGDGEEFLGERRRQADAAMAVRVISRIVAGVERNCRTGSKNWANGIGALSYFFEW